LADKNTLGNLRYSKQIVEKCLNYEEDVV
jgi:hypothetical protein